MDDNVTELPRRDLIAEMTGPAESGNAVKINGRYIPNLVMYDRGDEVEFVLDHRLAFSFPRAQAWDAAAFAFAAMAIGAGFAHPEHTIARACPLVREVLMRNAFVRACMGKDEPQPPIEMLRLVTGFTWPEIERMTDESKNASATIAEIKAKRAIGQTVSENT